MDCKTEPVTGQMPPSVQAEASCVSILAILNQGVHGLCHRATKSKRKRAKNKRSWCEHFRGQ